MISLGDLISYWKEENNSLIKTFELSDFKSAINFVNSLVDICEETDHHPNILIHDYKKVKISLTTHSENKITEKDYNLSKKFDEIYSKN
jgi:4a-hydroxytetrahydrobiopterin dehydratase